ncbi:MAG TPA: RluA family pseudouridine synthase [Tissierellaceae bacterium]|nr:RluA family pseudouridine synthase [Tissierellaceae bacterium]
MKKIRIDVDEDPKTRLDVYLSSRIKELSRTKIQELIKKELILVNNKKKKTRYLVSKNDVIDISIPKPKTVEVLPENIELEILYEDEDIAIVNKPQDMVVHPAPGNYNNTLVNGLLFHMDHLSTMGGKIRPGIVHRLDKDTSGLLVVAKNNYAYEILVNQFKERSVNRKYIALVYGKIKSEFGIINEPIGRNIKDRKKMAVNYTNGKEAITKYKVLKKFADYTLLEVKLETGRTHQIRVHLSHIKHPVLGDIIYSPRKNNFKLNGQLLHAIKIGFIHPRTKKYMEFKTDLPDRFKRVINKIY